MGKAVIVTPHTQWTANGDVMTHGRDGFVADCASVQCFTRGLLELRARPRILGELAINSFALAVGLSPDGVKLLFHSLFCILWLRSFFCLRLSLAILNRLRELL